MRSSLFTYWLRKCCAVTILKKNCGLGARGVAMAAISGGERKEMRACMRLR